MNYDKAVDLAEEAGDISVFQVFKVDVHRHVKPFDAGASGKIDPLKYFITSGDAVQKAAVLEADVKKLAAEVNSRGLSKTSRIVKAAATAVKSSGDFLARLKEARGTSIFLETEWHDHSLYVVPKNPRPAKTEQVDE